MFDLKEDEIRQFVELSQPATHFRRGNWFGKSGHAHVVFGMASKLNCFAGKLPVSDSPDRHASTGNISVISISCWRHKLRSG